MGNKITPQELDRDKFDITFGITDGGAVILDFNGYASYLSFEPEEALNFAAHIIAVAREAGAKGELPVIGAESYTDEHGNPLKTN